MINEYSTDTNVILITLDSCRWDSFEFASAKNLKSLCKFRKAYAQGTYTFPSHLSMYAGILPDVREQIPYYNRFCKNLFRIAGRRVNVASYTEFPEGTPNIISGFEARGYRTIGCAALEWFKNPALTDPFQQFHLSGINLASQINYVESKIYDETNPFFVFINIGETHDPYEFGGDIKPSLNSRARMRTFKNEGFLDEDFHKQISAIEFVDELLGPFLERISKTFKQTLVVVCADHGDCFGEDGLYGHGFFHPKVMEVPLGIFEI